MESFWGSIELMVFIYALAAIVSYLVAWILKLLYITIEKNKARSEAVTKAVCGASEKAD